MICGFGCRCKNAEPIARKVFRDAGISNFLGVPFYIGHEVAKQTVPQIDTADIEMKERLLQYILSQSGYSVIVGWDENELVYAEVGHGSPIDIVNGKVIVRNFY